MGDHPELIKRRVAQLDAAILGRMGGEDSPDAVTVYPLRVPEFDGRVCV